MVTLANGKDRKMTHERYVEPLICFSHVSMYKQCADSVLRAR